MMRWLRAVPYLEDTVYVLAGIFFAGFALRGFLIPNHFLDGGLTGMSLLVHEIFHWDLAVVIVLANIPFIIIGSKLVNMQFAVKTFLSVVGLALCLEFAPFEKITDNTFLVSTFGGFFLGLGLGLAMRAGCAIDGIEVLALYTWRKSALTMSEIILALNVFIFLVAAYFLGLEVALYAMLTYFIATRTIDFVVEGLEEYTGVTIVSGKSEEIKHKLVKDLGRGITVYKGERGFLKESFEVSAETDIVFTVITRLEVKRLRNVVHGIDPKAFIFTNTIKEAAGGVLKRKKAAH